MGFTSQPVYSQVVSSRVFRRAYLKTKVKNSWKHPTSTFGLRVRMRAHPYIQWLTRRGKMKFLWYDHCFKSSHAPYCPSCPGPSPSVPLGSLRKWQQTCSHMA